jgi:hypothetical protein
MSLQPPAAAADGKTVGGGVQVLLGGFAFWLLGPIFIAVHELGHASVALAQTDGRVEILLGRQPARWHFSVGRMDVAVNPISPLRGWNGGLTKPLGRFGPYSRIAFVLAGPIASGLFSAGVIYLGLALRSTLIVVVGAWGLFSSAYAFVPRRTGSDGTNLIAALRRLRPEPEIERQRRWLQLFKDPKGTLGPERGRVLNQLPPALGHPGTGPDAFAIWNMALAGFCWRAVEADPAQRGVVDPHVTFGAASKLAASAPDTGLDHLPRELVSSEVDEEAQRFAFRFGVALYDVEMARNASSTS